MRVCGEERMTRNVQIGTAHGFFLGVLWLRYGCEPCFGETIQSIDFDGATLFNRGVNDFSTGASSLRGRMQPKRSLGRSHLRMIDILRGVRRVAGVLKRGVWLWVARVWMLRAWGSA